MRYVPISPRFLLIKRSRYDEAFKVLKWLRRTETLDELEKELEEIATELEDYFLYRAVRHVHWNQLFKLSYMRKPMLISIMMMCAQQICGINVVSKNWIFCKLSIISTFQVKSGFPNFQEELISLLKVHQLSFFFQML